MADDSKNSSESEVKPEAEEIPTAVAENPSSENETAPGGGWGGWGFSPLSYLSDLQKAATVAAEEISRNVCAFTPSKPTLHLHLF